jgi:hypothetical protein
MSWSLIASSLVGGIVLTRVLVWYRCTHQNLHREKGEQRVRDELLAELRGLRKGTGMTLAKLERCPTLLAKYGTAQAAYDAVITTLLELGDGVEQRALANALAIGITAPGKLTDRRNDFGMANDGRHSDTIEAYENRMLEELVARIVADDAQPVPTKQNYYVDVLVMLNIDGLIHHLNVDAGNFRVLGGDFRKPRNWFIFVANPVATTDVRFSFMPGPVTGTAKYWRDIYDWQTSAPYDFGVFTKIGNFYLEDVPPGTVIQLKLEQPRIPVIDSA